MTADREVVVLIATTARCFGFLVALPMGEGIGTLPRFFMSVGLSFFLRESIPPVSVLSIGAYGLEFLIGYVLAAPVRAVVEVAEMVGELVDTARGQTIAAVNDPLNGIGSSELAVVAKIGATVVLMLSGVPEILLATIRASYGPLPLGTIAITEEFVSGVARMLASTVYVGLRVAAVWMGAFLLVDVVCAVSNRLLHALSFVQFGGALKFIATFLVLYQLMVSSADQTRRAVQAAASSWNLQGGGTLATGRGEQRGEHLGELR
jgi:flagellar biosynthesis protein FliR